MTEVMGLQNPGCYASELADCASRMSGEHYLSESILLTIDGYGNTVEVGGLPWLEPGTRRTIGTASLTGRILCERHNGLLSEFDSMALHLVQCVDRVHESFNDGIDNEFVIDGDKIERWMLKTLCGFIASQNMVNQSGERIPDWKPPREWLEILFEGRPFPAGSGLYLSRGNSTVEEITRQILKMVPLWAEDQRTCIGMQLWLFNVEYVMVMSESLRQRTEHFCDHVVYRPGAIIYHDPNCWKRLNFEWSQLGGHEVFEVLRLPPIS